MPTSPCRDLSLESLSSGIPIIFNGGEHTYIQRCVFTLDSQGHSPGTLLQVDSSQNGSNLFNLTWHLEATDELRRAHADAIRSVEDSACAIAFLLVRELTPYTVIEQSPRGKGVDYFLGKKVRDDNLIFNETCRLEVSGIICGTKNDINKRTRSKIRRLKDDFSAIIIVVEHSKPTALITNYP
jgi:hypothetical protein